MIDKFHLENQIDLFLSNYKVFLKIYFFLKSNMFNLTYLNNLLNLYFNVINILYFD